MSSSTPPAAADLVNDKVVMASAIILGVIFLAYSAYHLFLRFVKKIEFSKSVIFVAVAMFLAFFTPLIESLVYASGVTLSSNQLVYYGFRLLSTTAQLIWCISLFLVARGWDILSPQLSDVGLSHLKQVSIGAGVVFVLTFALLLPLPPAVAISLGFCWVFISVGFIIFFIVRFFQAISTTRAAIEVQNLIPVARREQFDSKYKWFLILCITIIVANVVLILSSFIILLFAFFSISIAVASIGIIQLILSASFNVILGWLFHARPSETLRLWSTTQQDLGGFSTLEERDEDLFA